MLLSTQNLATKSLRRESKPNITRFNDENGENLIEIGRICEKPSESIIIPLIKKFIYILKKSTGFYKLKSMSEASFLLLNDLSHFSSKNDIKAKKVTILNKI